MRATPLPRQTSSWLTVLGSGLLLAVMASWALAFLRVLRNGYLSTSEALSCSAISSTICDLATSLCGQTHPLGISWYSPLLLWSAAALLSAAALMAREKA